MPGLKSINDKQQSQQNSANREPRKELWLRDGDQAFVRAIATGEEGDPNLEELYLFTYQNGVTGRWNSTLVDPDTHKPMASGVPEGTSPSHKFALWVYCSEIIHPTLREGAEWEEVKAAGSGKVAYKEVVEDFRILILPFGRGNIYWNMLVDAYDEWGALDKGVLRVKRTGSGLDTSYTITPVSRKVDVPKSKEDERKALVSVWDYFVKHYGGQEQSEVETITPTSDDESDF